VFVFASTDDGDLAVDQIGRLQSVVHGLHRYTVQVQTLRLHQSLGFSYNEDVLHE
jgi:hypothetical protein